MSESYVRNVVEAALLAAGGPLPVAELLKLFDEHRRPAADEVRAALAAQTAVAIVGVAAADGVRAEGTAAATTVAATEADTRSEFAV